MSQTEIWNKLRAAWNTDGFLPAASKLAKQFGCELVIAEIHRMVSEEVDYRDLLYEIKCTLLECNSLHEYCEAMEEAHTLYGNLAVDEAVRELEKDWQRRQEMPSTTASV